MGHLPKLPGLQHNTPGSASLQLLIRPDRDQRATPLLFSTSSRKPFPQVPIYL